MNSLYLFSSALRGGLAYSGACNSWLPFFFIPFSFLNISFISLSVGRDGVCTECLCQEEAGRG